MDRRQRKSRRAIFEALISLLSEKSFNRITVEEIIKRADVGRATFYAHFETKDYLLRELCRELFCHIFDRDEKKGNDHRHIFECDTTDSAFLHLLRHLEKNDNHILDLLSCENNGLFMEYFRAELIRLIKSQRLITVNKKMQKLPEELLVNHIASTFIETVRWWLKGKRRLTPEQLLECFMTLINN